MHLRCERCSAVYELDDALLPPGGAPVQCSRCQHVFHAWAPPAAKGPPAVAVAPAAPAGAGPGEAAPGAERHFRSWRTWRWLAPVLLLALGGVAAGLLWNASGRIASAAVARREEGLRLLLRDDEGSLERAAEVLADASRLDPRLFQARADRALALTLLAADDRDRAAALESRFRAVDAEVSRLQADGAPAPSWRQVELIERMHGLEQRIQPLQEKAARLAAQAFAEVESLAGPHPDDAAVARARALHHVLDHEVGLAERIVRDARAGGLADPWLDLVEGAAEVVAPDAGSSRQRAVGLLVPLSAAHPDLLRARMLLARAEAELGRTDAAVAALDGVLEANPAHQVARELKERILRPPEPEASSPRVPQQAPPPGRPGLLPRKPGGAQP
ncbi:MAG TPA: zinc-ribbon domain-containing protein [Anaeromyxobacteraceae bacterium]|nr:zinc-ribbon domain-containing protein [Anaeromyxobacteraceae bacterium]